MWIWNASTFNILTTFPFHWESIVWIIIINAGLSLSEFLYILSFLSKTVCKCMMSFFFFKLFAPWFIFWPHFIIEVEVYISYIFLINQLLELSHPEQYVIFVCHWQILLVVVTLHEVFLQKIGSFRFYWYIDSMIVALVLQKSFTRWHLGRKYKQVSPWCTWK